MYASIRSKYLSFNMETVHVKNWLETIEQSLLTKKGSSPLVIPFLEDGSQLGHFKDILSAIEEPAVLLITVKDFRSADKILIVHPVLCKLLNSSTFCLIASVEPEKRVESIILSQVTKIDRLSGVPYMKPSREALLLAMESSGSTGRINMRDEDMRGFWHAFNNHMILMKRGIRAGKRRDYYTQLLLPKFRQNILVENQDSVLYAELSFKLSSKDHGSGIIKLLIQGRDHLLIRDRMQKEYAKQKAVKELFPKLNWSLSSGKSRNSILLTTEDFYFNAKLQEDSKYRTAVFDWYAKQVDSLKKVFKDIMG